MKTIAIRRTAGVATAAALAAVLAVGMSPAFAASVDPIPIEGNQDCNAATGLTLLTKIEPVSSKTQDGVTITVTGDTFDWSSTVTIAAVFVKGGPNGLLYDYRPAGATSDTDLHAPVNPTNGDFYGLSHVSFCVPDTSTTTQPTTPTTQPTTTTTEATTTTTEATTTTTEATTTTTEATTTTTEATTTTTEATTTTTEATTTTTEATTTTPPTTAPQAETTTTVGPEVQSTTTSTTPEVDEETTSTTTPESTLPFTGTDTGSMGMVALAALIAGAGLVGLTRSSAEVRGSHRR